ncbi:MAG TPA: CHAT domain-containing protein, partial [Thermoanaerobaculia bacterium]|nr:CHAT domain-containing protein [Thermoanaerobaculia bacterium]
LTRSIRDLGLDHLERLPGTRREAERIADLDPGSFVALDFFAGREILSHPAVRRARLLHLATHSLMNPRNPALSGIVLSLVDEQGRPQQGFLRADEIAELGLSADLVVLSACKTALGPEVRGEGLLSLARAFFEGGASRVVVSLWAVEDNASADLMTRFYDGLLRQGLPAAAALRQAQLATRDAAEKNGRSEWAAFELQGDWR